MSEDKVFQCLVAIYAVFQKTAPSRSSPTVKMLASKVQDIPDRLDTYIVDKIAERDTLPQNLINAFKGAWTTWRMENPGMVRHETCPVCHGHGGWLYFREAEGRLREFFSFCPVCSRKEGMVCKTEAELLESGLLVLPNDYPGGRLKFIADHDLALYGEVK